MMAIALLALLLFLSASSGIGPATVSLRAFCGGHARPVPAFGDAGRHRGVPARAEEADAGATAEVEAEPDMAAQLAEAEGREAELRKELDEALAREKALQKELQTTQE